MPAPPRRTLIVNADDFGHSAEVNAGVVEAHERGIVTSASLMVKRAAAPEAARYGGRLAVGLHVELGEWSFLDGEWRSEAEVPPEDVAREVRGQLALFRDLTGRDPSHLDSHQHAHRREPARSALAALGRELGVPVRHLDSRVRYVGRFYGQTDEGEPLPDLVSPDALVALIRRLDEGVTELACHPARGTAPGTSYAAERALELEALCHPLVRQALVEEDIVLQSFADLR